MKEYKIADRAHDQLLGVPPLSRRARTTRHESRRARTGVESARRGGRNQNDEAQDSRHSRQLRAGGRRSWRSLEAVAETPEFQEFLHREFPANASEWIDPVGRRTFLKLMSASLALAGVTACTRSPTN